MARVRVNRTVKITKITWYIVVLIYSFAVRHVLSIAQEKIFEAKNGQKMKASYLHTNFYKDKMLVVTPIAAFVVPTPKDCRQKCLQSPPCISMNIKEHNVTFVACYLLDKDEFTEFGRYKGHLIDAIGVDHYYIAVSRFLTINFY